MAWYNKLGKVALGAAKGYSAAAQGGLAGGLMGGGALMGAAQPIVNIIKKKKKNNLTGMGQSAMGADPGGETVDLSQWRIGMPEPPDDEFLV